MNSSPVLVNSTLYVAGSNHGITPRLYVFKLPGADGEALPGAGEEEEDR